MNRRWDRLVVSPIAFLLPPFRGAGRAIPRYSVMEYGPCEPQPQLVGGFPSRWVGLAACSTGGWQVGWLSCEEGCFTRLFGSRFVAWSRFALRTGGEQRRWFSPLRFAGPLERRDRSCEELPE